MNRSAPGAYCKTPVAIETRTPEDFVASLPGQPISRRLLRDIDNQIACVKRERTAARDETLYASELMMLEAYHDQVVRILMGGR